ncbi:hypothetical protein ABOZ73_17690 [Caulobacter sp. 73W]|uniref:DUF2946 domain-containing protein n=1 Tax=Caulobacter sp. 73W TaxID=3161137 RepID=A0AB39KT96_9CAUL
MTNRGIPAGLLWRHVCLTLAMIAVALKITIPAGMMISTEPRNELPFPLVICTGHGALTIDPGAVVDLGDDQGDDAKLKHQPPCLFAGQGAAAEAPALVGVAPVERLAFASAPRPRSPPSLPDAAFPARPCPPAGLLPD